MTDTDGQTTEAKPHRPFIPHFIRILAIPIILAWVALTVVVNVAVPELEVVGEYALRADGSPGSTVE